MLTGLVGAWCPSLGPSGYTLLDRSGRGRHGTLTNMNAGSDWVGSPGGWAIDFDGTNDYIPVSTGNWAFPCVTEPAADDFGVGVVSLNLATIIVRGLEFKRRAGITAV